MLYASFFINYLLLSYLSHYAGKRVAINFIADKPCSKNKKQTIALCFFVIAFLVSCGIAGIFVYFQNQEHRDFFFARINYNGCFMTSVFYVYLFYAAMSDVVDKRKEPIEPNKNN